MKSLPAALLLLFLAAPTPAPAAATASMGARVEPAKASWVESSRQTPLYPVPLRRDPMKTTVHRLPNGLTVYLSPNDQEPRITAWIVTRAGATRDPRESTGMAHYLEHMLFKGSRKLGTLDYAKEEPHLEKILALYEKLFDTTDEDERKAIYSQIDGENQEAARYEIPNEMDKIYKSLGVQGVNAFTTKEFTAFICDIPKNRLEAWARLESNRFHHPVFRLFQTEIETVYEEFNRSRDNPWSLLWEAFDKGLYGKHPYGTPVIGKLEHLKNPSLKKMYEFFDANYRPNNMAVVLSGDFDNADALRVLGEYFGSLEPKKLAARDDPAIVPLKGEKRVEVRYEAEEVVMVGWQTVSKLDPDAAALQAMDMVLSNSETGIIDLRLNQAQEVKHAGSSLDLKNEGGAFYLYALPKKDQTLEEAEALLLQTIEGVKNGEFSEEDLKANILNFEIGEKRKLEGNGGRVGSMADAFVSFEDWPHKVDWLKRMRAVTKADVIRVAKKYLGPDRVVVFRRKGKPEIPSIKKPEFTKVAITTGRESEFYKELAAMPAVPIEPKWVKKRRDYTVKKIPSGRLYVVKNPVNDLFSLSFVFERGKEHERRLCAAFELLDKSGAGKMSAEDFKRRLYGLGLSMDTGCGERSSSVHLSGIEENLEEGLRLLRRRIAEPHVAPGTLEKMVQIWIGQHKDNKVNPDYVNSALADWAQRGQKSSILAQLTDDELRALKEDELKAILGRVFDYERRASYVGTRSQDVLASLLERPGKSYLPAPERTPRKYLEPGKNRVIFTHRDMVQSKVGIAAPDGTYKPRKAVDYKFYRSYMGGGMSSVAFQEIREARSLAYSAWIGYIPGGYKGDENRVYGALGTQADKTIEATGLLYKLMRELPPSQARLEESRKSILEGYRTNRIKFRQIAGAVMGWEDLGLKRDPRPKTMKRVKKYRLKDLVRFSKRFEDEPMTFFILGNRDRVDLEALKKLGDFTEKTVDDLFPY